MPHLLVPSIFSPTLHTSSRSEGGSSVQSDLAPLALRLIAGFGFLAHGYAKLSRGPEAFAVVLHTLGVPASHAMAWLTTLVELIGGCALILGAFLPIVSGPLAIVLLTALFTVHWRYGFFSVKLAEVDAGGIRFGSVGYEIILLYLACLAALALGGAGAWSVDGWRAARRASGGPRAA
jgi:putative oxidoreductase